MSIRLSRLATGLLVVAAMVVMANQSWAIRQGLPPSQDEWGLKYDLSVEDTGSDLLTIQFTLENEGRLRPIYSFDVVAFSKQTDAQGGRSYDVMEPLKLTKGADGKLAGQVQIPKKFADRAKVRIISLTVDGKRQPSGGVFWDIPILKHWKNAPATSPDVASPPAAKKVRK